MNLPNAIVVFLVVVVYSFVIVKVVVIVVFSFYNGDIFFQNNSFNVFLTFMMSLLTRTRENRNHYITSGLIDP